VKYILPFSLKKVLISFVLLAPPVLIYFYFVRQFNFIQDDAYISYRYVANYLNGDGLVFNIGERVEGITNFGWTIFLILVGAFKVDFIATSKIIGTIFGAGIIIISFLTARLLFKSEDKWFAFLPPYLLGANMALAYWAQSGLETAAFSFFASLIFYLFLIRSRWLILALTLAVWIRPEGALVALILILTETIVEKRMPKYSFACAAVAFVILLPFALFKYFYYGSILPNSFYAKTGMAFEQIQAGLDYTGLYFRHYGFLGAGIIISVIFWKKLNGRMRSVLIFTLCYSAYIVLIGGDVLKVHRFFLPVVGVSAILVVYSIRLLTEIQSPQNRLLMILIAPLPLLSMTYLLPKDYVYLYHNRELGLVNSMQTLAREIKSTDSTNFSVALTTIGAFSYELVGHTVIDMLGLTDTMVARHPEPPIKGFETTWREQNFNASYVLRREPNYIVFSTGAKPSAPAEQALLLFSQFLESYKSLYWYQPNPAFRSGGTLCVAFKKVRELKGEIEPKYPPDFVRLFKKGYEFRSAGRNEKAIGAFDSAIAVSLAPVYCDLLFQKALSHSVLHQKDTAETLLNLILMQDSMVFVAHRLCYFHAVIDGNSAKAQLHKEWILRIAPWYLPRLELEVQAAIARGKSS